MTTLSIQGTKTNQLTKKMATALSPINATFRGTTTSTDVTELFIDAISNYRIQPPEQSLGSIVVQCMGYNATDDTAIAATETRATFSRLGATMTVTQNTDVTNVYNDAQCTITADDTNEYVKVNVTAADTDETRWVVYATIYCQAEENIPATGVYDAVVK